VSGIDELLARSRARLERVDPIGAQRLVASGALFVDIRPAAQRARFGEIPGALVIERNVLEWRLDPNGPDRLAEVNGAEHPIVVFCQEGYASSLAAASLQDLGLARATDLDGGFRAWREAGLAVSEPTDPAPSST
jgi:rhodanese-related sulfurtransferase